MIVDDVALNRVLMKALVEQLGNATPILFENPRDALARCEIQPPELVLLDYSMPEMTGAEFIRRFRTLPQCAAVPVLVVTARSDRDTLLEVLDAGGNDFVRKPVDEVEFCARARSMLKLGQASRALYMLSATDELTGLASRRAFLGALESEVDRAERYSQHFSLAMFDVDHFKRINDTLGHPAGDAILRSIGEAALQIKRKADWVGRLGGEEFGFLLPATSLERATDACSRLRRQIAMIPPTAIGPTTISIGIAPYVFGEGLESVMFRADEQVYAAKSAGRDCIAY
jgi:diguanylate cyclase (GGDEF)-like protein